MRISGWTPNVAYPAFYDALANSVSATIRQLLETKHLYQRLDVPPWQADAERLLEKPSTTGGSNEQGFEWVETLGEPHGGHKRNALKKFIELASTDWKALEPGTQRSGRGGEWQLPTGSLAFSIPDCKLFCGECDRREPFNALSGFEIAPRRTRTKQLFGFNYLCQSCKKAPETFMVARDAARLVLVGRNPMERFETPPAVPKTVRRFYERAMIAFQSGERLAGNFMLRALIEQFMREKTRATSVQKADQVVEAYMASLPVDFNSNFPSLREVFSRLSADIHAATGSAGVFETSRDEIERHFQGRAAFRL